MDPIVSVIMPAYNCEEFVGFSIESILNQTFERWELIICDDASRDGTKAIINRYSSKDSRIVVSHNLKNQKLLKTRNRLLGLCRGELVTFQDADDYSHPDRLLLMVEEFRRNSNLGVLATQVGYINRRGVLLRTSNKPLNYEEVIATIFTRNCIGGSVMMIRKCALDSVGGVFRPYFDGLSYQDYDLSILLAQRFEAYSLPEVLYYYRQHENSASKSISVERLLAKDVVIHLAKQREESGTDDLILSRAHLVDQYFDELKRPYQEDPSLVLREYASNFMYNNMYKKAIYTCLRAVKIRPLKLLNWQTLQYCIRKSCEGVLFSKRI